ncbi:hypothetical protein PoB_005856500 [Plakobranchus ocellatus]|uniref:Uncharacterized protein n=1 Tax=Plakobranchus ocellatus TaxID=259542 RepID=A0AAV4CJP4_9GAST|nr:hypothetical protein PoB_005856500 [Plakobranchus ocellatus]
MRGYVGRSGVEEVRKDVTCGEVSGGRRGERSPQKGEKLSGPPSGQFAGGGARTHVLDTSGRSKDEEEKEKKTDSLPQSISGLLTPEVGWCKTRYRNLCN